METSNQYTKEQGVQAIIDLQKMSGVDEPRDKAETAWDAMSQSDRLRTEAAHRVMYVGGRPTQSTRVHQIFMELLFKDDELDNGKPPQDAVLVKGIVQDFGFHRGRLEAEIPKIVELVKEIVPDEFLIPHEPPVYPGAPSAGGGMSFLQLCISRSGEQWAEHNTMEKLYVLARAIGIAGLCMKRSLWGILPGGMPYLWFDPVATPRIKTTPRLDVVPTSEAKMKELEAWDQLITSRAKDDIVKVLDAFRDVGIGIDDMPESPRDQALALVNAGAKL